MEADATHGTAAELAVRSGIWPGTWRAATAYLLVGSLAGVNAGAATVGTVIAAVPVVLAVAGPLAARRRPTRRVIGAAALVTAGAAVVTGLGGTNLTGLLLAFGALAAAICYLAVAVGAGGFYFLYSALPRLGADRVGLYAGLVPFGAIGAAAVLSAATIVPADIGGAILVAAGVATGASAASTHPTQRRARAAAKPPEPKARGTAWTEERGTSDEGRRWLKARRRREANTARRRREKVERRHRGSAGRGRGHRVLGIHRADGGTARRGAAA